MEVGTHSRIGTRPIYVTRLAMWPARGDKFTCVDGLSVVMPSLNPELLTESLQLLVYTVVAGALTAGGIAAEYASLQHFGAGEMTAALWLAAIGGVMLYAGIYGIAYKKVLARTLASSQPSQ